MNTKKKTLEEVFTKNEASKTGLNGEVQLVNLNDGLIAEIQALTKEAIPEAESLCAKSVCEHETTELEDALLHAFEIGKIDGVNKITTALIERGLLKGEEE